MSDDRDVRLVQSVLSPICDRLRVSGKLLERALEELMAKVDAARGAEDRYQAWEADVREQAIAAARSLTDSSKLARALEDLEAARAALNDPIALLRGLVRGP